MTLKLPHEDYFFQRNMDQIRVNIEEQTRMINRIEANCKSLVEQITESLIKTRQLDKKYVDIMLKADWPPVMDINYDHMHMIIAEHEKEDFDTFKGNLDRRLLEYFDEKIIEEKLSAWRGRKILQGRIHILDAIIKAHLNDDFILSIPVLITQIEGIIAEHFNHKGKFKSKHYSEYLSDIASTSNHIPDFKALKIFIENTLCQNFEWGSPIPASLNRHAILHGACTDFGTKLNSVKTIVLFDLLLFSFELNDPSHIGDHEFRDFIILEEG